MKLSIQNPIQDAIRQTSGLNRIGGLHGDLRFRAFCWTCSKDKPKKGGTLRGAKMPTGRGHQGPQRFTCFECLQEKAKP